MNESNVLSNVDVALQATRRFLDYEGGKCVCTDSLSTMGLKCKCKVQRKAVEYLKNQFLSTSSAISWTLLFVAGEANYSPMHL